MSPRHIHLRKTSSLSSEAIRRIASETLAQGGYHSSALHIGDPVAGQTVPGQGVFLGRWSPDGGKLGKVFNLFAAPCDLDGMFSYTAAVRSVAALKDWHGHAGGDYPTEAVLFSALRDGSYVGEWFIPPLALLCGQTQDSVRVAQDNLYDRRITGDFLGSFHVEGGRLPRYNSRYWSSTEDRNHPDIVWSSRFSADGGLSWEYKDKTWGRCRPVRAVIAGI